MHLTNVLGSSNAGSHWFHWRSYELEQCFSNSNVITNHLGINADSDSIRLGWSLRFHVSNKLPGDSYAAGLLSTFWIPRSKNTDILSINVVIVQYRKYWWQFNRLIKICIYYKNYFNISVYLMKKDNEANVDTKLLLFFLKTGSSVGHYNDFLKIWGYFP